MVLAALSPATLYLRHAWELIPTFTDHTQRVEYRLTKWIAEHLPGVRTMATGSLRFWYNAWFDLPQVGGGSEQGVTNLKAAAANFEIVGGQDPALAVLWMQALAAGAVVVHDQTSEETYHDFADPKKFQNSLAAIYDDGRGDVIYEVPRRFPDLARVVERSAIEDAGTVKSTMDRDTLERWRGSRRRASSRDRSSSRRSGRRGDARRWRPACAAYKASSGHFHPLIARATRPPTMNTAPTAGKVQRSDAPRSSTEDAPTRSPPGSRRAGGNSPGLR